MRIFFFSPFFTPFFFLHQHFSNIDRFVSSQHIFILVICNVFVFPNEKWKRKANEKVFRMRMHVSDVVSNSESSFTSLCVSEFGRSNVWKWIEQTSDCASKSKINQKYCTCFARCVSASHLISFRWSRVCMFCLLFSCGVFGYFKMSKRNKIKLHAESVSKRKTVVSMLSDWMCVRALLLFIYITTAFN